MTPEERDVIKMAEKWAKRGGSDREIALSRAVQCLAISRQPLHTVDPIPCGVYANNSATMFCILPVGHEGSVPEEEGRYGVTYHVGWPGGNSDNGRRTFKHWPWEDTMEEHPRAACARFPGCERHP